MNTRYAVQEITDVDYYYMIENQVRDEMPKFEAGVLLPAAIQLLKDSGIKDEELKEYPIEGYYYKSDALKHYFTIIRNLQHNKDVCDKITLSQSIRLDKSNLNLLQEKCDNDIWGEPKPYTSGAFQGLLKRRYDIVTLTMEDRNLFNPNSTRPWTIDSIVEAVNKHVKNRVNLVELAALTKDAKCLCCGAETNSLYRMYALISGYFQAAPPTYIWKVSKNVQELGEKLVDAYNELIGSNMVKPTIFNHTTLKKTYEQPRVARLGFVEFTGEYYYWILKDDYLYDQYSTEEITTESIKNERAEGKSI